MFSRRFFLKNSGIAMAGVGAIPGWLSRAVYAQDNPSARKKVLVAIFQRGAVDGLNVVPPHGENAYYTSRPTIAIPRPNGTAQSAIDLDGRFGLHPSLRALKPLFDRRELAIIQACGSPDPTRSHFDAQDYMESGTPGRKATTDGWLNRALPNERLASPMRAVSLTPDLPRSLRGVHSALAVGNVKDFRVRDNAAGTLFENLYGETPDRILSSTAHEAFDAVKVLQNMQKQPYYPANNASYPTGRLGQSLQQIARLIKADVGLEVAFTDVGGWDTHVNEVGAQPHVGQLANLLQQFGDSLGAFYQDLGDRMADVTVVSMSEFGRTVRENGNRGTDHGHANVMFVLGGDVNGGIHGRWPGLEREQLYEGRDLDVTTDFRAVLAELVARQLGNRDLHAVFPGFAAPPQLDILRA